MTSKLPEASAKEAMFMLSVILNMEGKPKIDWAKVAEANGLKSKEVASVRFGQIKRKLQGADGTGTPKSSPAKGAPVASSGTGKKRKTDGQITTPSKRGKKGEVAAAEERQDDDEETHKDVLGNGPVNKSSPMSDLVKGEAVVALEAELDEGEQEDLCPNDGTHA